MTLGVEEGLGNAVWGTADGESFWGEHCLSKQAGVSIQQADWWWSRSWLWDVCRWSRWSTGVGRFSIWPAMQVQNGECDAMIMMAILVVSEHSFCTDIVRGNISDPWNLC